MQVEGFFEWLGQALGTVIRFIVDALSGLFQMVSRASSNFVDGLSRALGMDTPNTKANCWPAPWHKPKR